MCVSSNCSIPVSSFHLVHRDVATEVQPASSEGAWQKALRITSAWQARSVETCCPQRQYYCRVDRRCQQRHVQVVFKERRSASEWSNGQNSRCSCFCPIFNQAAGSLLSCPLAHWNCVTDISYTRFLTSVHRRIQPAPTARRFHTNAPTPSAHTAQPQTKAVRLPSPSPPPHPSTLKHIHGDISAKPRRLDLLWHSCPDSSRWAVSWNN